MRHDIALLKEKREVLASVRQIYTELSQRPNDRNCIRQSACCHFKLTGRTPYLTKGEAMLAATAWRATGRKSLPVHPDGACPMIDANMTRCLIYEERPFGCRTHFCAAAGGPLERGGVIDLIRRLERIDAQLNGVGSRELGKAVGDALREE